MAYGYPVQIAQGQLANTIRSGLSGLADRPLQEARLSLTKMQLLDEIRRNKANEARAAAALALQEASGERAEKLLTHQIETGKAAGERAERQLGLQEQQWEAGAPLRRFQSEQARTGLETLLNQRELRNQPLTIDAIAPLMFGEEASPESIMDFTANKKMQKILEATGGSFKNGQFIKKNGKIATWGDLPNIMAIAQPILRSDADPGHQLNQRIREYEEMVGKGGTTNPEEEAWYQKAKAAQKDPNWLIDQYEKQNEEANTILNEFKRRGIPTGTLENNIARRDKKLARLQGTVAERRKHADAIELAEIKAAGSLIGGIQKDATFLSKVSGLDLSEATNIVRYDKTMGQRLKGAAEELRLIDPDLYEPEQLDAKVKEIKKNWGIDSASLKKSQSAIKTESNKTTENDNDPDNIRGLLFK